MDVNEFWEHARTGADLNTIQEWVGPRAWGTVPPPAWELGDTPQRADELAEQVVDGTKTTTTSLHWQYEAQDAELPVKGDLALILDGSDEPRALVLTTDVRIVAFDEVDEQHALGEAASLEDWRRIQEQVAHRSDDGHHPFSSDMPVVLERFEVLYARQHPA